MPIYEYQCQACGHELEALQKLSDEPLRDCPGCEAPQLQKKISAAGFRLKGGGWYETDFKKTAQKNLAGDSAKPATAESSGSGSGSGSGSATANSATASSGAAAAE